MKNIINLFLPIAIVVVLAGFYVYSKVQKDNWVKEPLAIKYSEVRENQVWGGVLRGDDAALFYGTPLYDLADEMSGFFFMRNQSKIARLIKELPQDYINYQEEKYGMTIGHFALVTRNLKAIRLLLDRGLNPNLIDKSGDAIIIYINSPGIAQMPESLETLKYMLKKGANVNLYSEKAQHKTPLIRAVNSSFENVKVLIEAGANPHFIDKSSENPLKSALSAALLSKTLQVTNYLIFEQKVDFRTLKYPNWSKFHPGEYIILHELRDKNYDLNSKEYQDKMKLVAYLKTQGLDYWKTPIPDDMKSNSSYTKEYLSKY
jgi:uncharacterized protein